MFGSKGVCLPIVIIGSILVAGVRSDCTVSSADNCLPTAEIQDLPVAGNVTIYCPAAASLAYSVYVCLDECNFTVSSGVNEFLTRFRNTCSAPSKCRDIGDFYTEIHDCFDKFGSLSSLIDDVIDAFNGRRGVDKLCRSLAQTRNCVKSSLANCPFLQNLWDETYTLFPNLGVVQRICGSENVPSLTDDGECRRNHELIATVNRECDIACSISATSDPKTICMLLQDQVDCITRLAAEAECPSIEKRFLLPRLNTYAFANMVLECPSPLQVRGVNIQPIGLSPDYPEDLRCKYVPQINDCFQFHLSGPVSNDVLMKLLNGNFLLDHFCELEDNGNLYWDQLMKQCTDGFLRCRLPVAEVYERETSYDSSYNVSLGPFPLDAWGLNTILSTLSCPSPPPPTLCQRSAFTRVASSLASLRPTLAVTKRTTPVRKDNTPVATSQSVNTNVQVSDPETQRNPNQPQYRPTPSKARPTPKRNT